MTDKMTVTETLRQLLDERGVEWWPLNDVESGYYEDCDTEFLVNGCKYVAHEWGRRLQVDMLTPEQAVEATLGRGTCKYDFVPNIGNGFLNACGLKCSCCGREQMSMDAPKFCPDCGMRVEDEQ